MEVLRTKSRNGCPRVRAKVTHPLVNEVTVGSAVASQEAEQYIWVSLYPTLPPIYKTDKTTLFPFNQRAI